MDEYISSYEFLNKNIYNKNKRKLLVYPIKVEYDIISNFLLNPKVIIDFFKKEFNNIFQIVRKKKTNNQNMERDYNIFILPNNNPNKKNDFFKVKSIFHKNYINHSLLILRFIKEEVININNDNNKDENNVSKSEQILDNVISFYVDIADNSTLLINEIYSNFDEHLFTNFVHFIHFFYQKMKKYVHEKINYFYCFKSILIPKKMSNIFDYLYSCKIFHHEKFKISEIKKFKSRTEISCIIGSLFPVNICEAKLCIISLSNYICLVEIESLMNPSCFNEQEKLLNINSIFSVFLKKLKNRIDNENNNPKIK